MTKTENRRRDRKTAPKTKEENGRKVPRTKLERRVEALMVGLCLRARALHACLNETLHVCPALPRSLVSCVVCSLPGHACAGRERGREDCACLSHVA